MDSFVDGELCAFVSSWGGNGILESRQSHLRKQNQQDEGQDFVRAARIIVAQMAHGDVSPVLDLRVSEVPLERFTTQSVKTARPHEQQGR